jgi:hypothetical protein
MMKLSEDAKKLAESLMSKDHYQVALWSEGDISRVRASRTQSNPKFNELITHHEENVRKTFTYIINAYAKGYEMDNSLIDDEDKDEIIEFIKDMINRRLHHITNSVVGRDFYHPYTGEKIPNLDSQLAGRFERLLGEAAVELNFKRNQMVLEQKRRARDEQLRANQINIYGHNYGNIQQGGSRNTQSVNTRNDENK